ncbi:MAG: tetratricopeptide repeat protein [Gammaproteobacteria bacterium]|nr:tetratricopeptide repeat protein [Gammaproteobacteria bacterium]
MEKDFNLGCWHVCHSEGTLVSAEITRRIEPKALAVLSTLAKAEGKVVSRDQLFEDVWPDQVVGEDVINSSIATLRKALGDDRKANKYIQTIPKKGYMLVQDVQWIDVQVETSDRTNSGPSHNTKTGRNNRPLLAVLFAIVAVAFIYFVTHKQPAAVPDQTNYSIAILPFDVYSSEQEMKYFADGMVDEMLHQLSASPKLKVIARSASFLYENSDKQLSTIASELHVNYLIEGSVRAYNNELRISVQLFDARNNIQLWSRVFDDKTGDLFRIQQQVGVAVHNMLDIGNESEVVKISRSHPDSDQAYKYFIMAQAHYKNANVDSYDKAIELLDKALFLSPDYALAYSSKAIGHLLRFQYNGEDLSKAVDVASVALEKALKIDPLQPEAYAATGLMYTYTQEYDKAEPAFVKAIELNPKLRLARHNFGYMLWKQGRNREALEQLEAALAIDPLAKPTNYLVGDTLASLAEFDKAIDHYKHCQSVLPDYVWCYSGIAKIYRVIGEINQAKIEMEKSLQVEDTGDSWRDIGHSSLLINLGQFQQATDMLDRVEHIAVTGNRFFRNRLLIAVALENEADFIAYINMKYKKYPKNHATKKYRAYTAFMQNDYELAITLYESVIQENSKSIFNIWDYADGISHGLNLAVSYEKTGQLKKREQILMQLKQHLGSFSERLEKVSGVHYIQAKYEAMIGNTSKSQKLLKLVRDNWSLNWLLEQDTF